MSAFNPCVLIPIYNHADTIRSVVESLAKYDLDCLIVNDGSDEATCITLDKLVGDFDFVKLRHLPSNQGKGVAVTVGFKWALEEGFSHALQIDADGQHDSRSVPEFLELAMENPQAVIIGNPVFDESVPLIRLWGRKLTNILIWLQTLSFRVKDGLCGYRLYPLATTCEVIEKYDCGKRMDFDPSLLVKLIWQGTPVKNLDTPVVYPENGISHFRMFNDNLLIARSHMNLVFGMLARLPSFLLGKLTFAKKLNSKHWSSISERGGRFALYLMLFVYKLLGRKLSGFFAFPVAVYFYCTSSNARKAVNDYWFNLSNYRPDTKTSFLTSLRHFYEFALVLVDKLAVWAGDISFDDLIWEDRTEFYDLINSKQGFIILGAHVGNIEIGRCLSRSHSEFKVNALMYREHARGFQAVLSKLSDASNLAVVPLESIGSDTVINLQDKITAGELVTMLSDRVSFGAPDKSLEVNFLGKPAKFPTGPLVLAALLKCPVYTIFFMRESDGRYRINFKHFADSIELPRRQRTVKLQEYLESYVTVLEQQIKDYPMQWFNFYPFWAIEEPVVVSNKLQVQQ